ncbi:hypothetical protein HYH03_011242 [Edaphochlamys debaryana]|uniref:Uncharacterized protein n=1 Tax=Edaphochlamys debaryana TaxID=47281 RepID=A0A835XV10_9CHLO|nr:hypothetical protein HYH03_011242 [Edaphochlamys debaryana]|eukprot:KAG2490290.1 hypothetical protein HYH03_011242 [Edaphochlamys debaryana]
MPGQQLGLLGPAALAARAEPYKRLLGILLRPTCVSLSVSNPYLSLAEPAGAILLRAGRVPERTLQKLLLPHAGELAGVVIGSEAHRSLADLTATPEALATLRQVQAVLQALRPDLPSAWWDRWSRDAPGSCRLGAFEVPPTDVAAVAAAADVVAEDVAAAAEQGAAAAATSSAAASAARAVAASEGAGPGLRVAMAGGAGGAEARGAAVGPTLVVAAGPAGPGRGPLPSSMPSQLTPPGPSAAGLGPGPGPGQAQAFVAAGHGGPHQVHWAAPPPAPSASASGPRPAGGTGGASCSMGTLFLQHYLDSLGPLNTFG